MEFKDDELKVAPALLEVLPNPAAAVASTQFTTLVLDIQLHILRFCVVDVPPRAVRPKGFRSSGVRVENRHLAAIATVNRQLYELTRPLLWKNVRIRSSYGKGVSETKEDKARLFQQVILPRQSQFITVLVVDQFMDRAGQDLPQMIRSLPALRRLDFRIKRERDRCEGVSRQDPAKEQSLVAAVAGLQQLEHLTIRGEPSASFLPLAVDTRWSSRLRTIAIHGHMHDQPMPYDLDSISITTLFAFLSKFSPTLQSVNLDYPFDPPKARTANAPVLPPYLLLHLRNVRLGRQTPNPVSLCNTFVSRSPSIATLDVSDSALARDPSKEEWGWMRGLCKTLGIRVIVSVDEKQGRPAYDGIGSEEEVDDWDSSESEERNDYDDDRGSIDHGGDLRYESCN